MISKYILHNHRKNFFFLNFIFKQSDQIWFNWK